MIRLSLLFLAVLAIPHLAGAQAARSAAEEASKTPPTLVIMAAGSTGDRLALSPAIETLCGEFSVTPGNYRDVVRVQSAVDLTPVQLSLTPKESESQKGAILRQVQGGLEAQAFQSCLDGRVPERLQQPLEIVLLGFTLRNEAGKANITVKRYRLADTLSPLGQPFDAHLDLYQGTKLLGMCIGQHYWKHGSVSESECAAAIAPAHSRRAPSVPQPLAPVQMSIKDHGASPPSGGASIAEKWWFWSAIGVLVAGAATAIILTTSGGVRDVYPKCPEGVVCPRSSEGSVGSASFSSWF